jgi:predicted transcriptional regulator
MLIVPYSEQLKWLASEQRVDLLDAVKHAGLNTSVYYRSIEGRTQLRQSTAEAIAAAIKDLGVH